MNTCQLQFKRNHGRGLATKASIAAVQEEDFVMPEEGKFVADIPELQRQLTEIMKRRQQDEIPIVIVFSDGDSKFAKENIVPLVKYWHHRSDEWTHIFFPGYKNADLETRVFDGLKFSDGIKEIEEESDWEYPGGSVALLCRAYLAYDAEAADRIAKIDYATIVEFELNENKRDAANSIGRFLETLIIVAKKTPGGNIRAEFAKKLAARSFERSLSEIDRRFDVVMSAVKAIRVMLA